VRYPSGEKLPRLPVHGHACDVASPTEDSVVAVAFEIQDAQTAKEVQGKLSAFMAASSSRIFTTPERGRGDFFLKKKMKYRAPEPPSNIFPCGDKHASICG
jgi:hypothetical protein